VADQLDSLLERYMVWPSAFLSILLQSAGSQGVCAHAMSLEELWHGI
jgi:hypothetical protein